ncbi:DUF590 family protein [Pelomyxa schiedti]|nr:DUF590 family protein [Pelomyxa schiedti]
MSGTARRDEEAIDDDLDEGSAGAVISIATVNEHAAERERNGDDSGEGEGEGTPMVEEVLDPDEPACAAPWVAGMAPDGAAGAAEGGHGDEGTPLIKAKPPSKLRVFLDGFMGIAPPSQNQQMKIPKGYEVLVTRSGCRYLKKIKKHKKKKYEIDEAEEAFSLQGHRPRLLASKAQLGEYYGTGVELYFRYLLFIIGTNLTLVVFALINFIPHCALDLTRSDWSVSSVFAFGEYYDKRKLLYLSSYESPTFYYWFSTILISAVTWFSYGFVYNVMVGRFFKTRNIIEDEYDFEDDEIKENLSITSFNRLLRFLFSAFVFVSMLGISCGVTFGFTILQINLEKSTLFSTMISLVISVVRMIWTSVASALTKFERHRTWASFKNHVLFKWYWFKVLNLICVYISRWLVADRYADQFTYTWNLPDFPWEDSGSESGTTVTENACGLVYMGDQFMTLVIIDLIVSNAMEVVLPLCLPIIMKLLCCFFKKNDDSKVTSRKQRPEFDLAEEYLEILYRQFVICFGMPFFPLLAVLGFIVNLIEVFVDRIRLIYICKKPPMVAASLRRRLIFYMFITAVLSVVAFPVGTGWILAGYNYGTTSECNTFWPWYNNTSTDTSSSSTILSSYYSSTSL